MARCECHVTLFLPPRRWTDGLGLTIDRVREAGLVLGQTTLLTNETPGEGDRYVLCPVGGFGFVHPAAHAARVVWCVAGRAKVSVARALCTCGSHTWFGSPSAPSRWTRNMGLTAEQAMAEGLTISG